MIPFKRISLGFYPTPLVKLESLTKLLSGPEIYIKRDDLTGLAFGGNKTRKLEYLFGDAKSQNCDTIITAGAQQSNHCRQTAAAAAFLGMECHLVLGGEQPSEFKGNLLLDKLFGAQLHYCENLRKGEKMPEIVEQLKAIGKTPYVVPYGGSNCIGTLGFVTAVEELKLQMTAMDLHFSHMVFASSSGGTHAGLMVGKALYNLDTEILGIGIDKDDIEGMQLEKFIVKLANATARKLDLKMNFHKNDIYLNNNYLGEGYGTVGEAEKEAIDILARFEGILLDPVYTARAMAGLIDLIRQQQFDKKDKVFFWHTGGTPALFPYASQLF
jgi:D-cysteine desulfhydrase